MQYKGASRKVNEGWGIDACKILTKDKEMGIKFLVSVM